MSQETPNKKLIISPDMTILDIVSKYRQTEAIFRQFDQKAGECLCCNALFDPLKDVADKYELDLNELLEKLMSAIKH
jgi:hypothetical protein